jgi:hypothetical protein
MVSGISSPPGANLALLDAVLARQHSVKALFDTAHGDKPVAREVIFLQLR